MRTTNRRQLRAFKRVVIDPSAVEAFYEQQLDDWRWIKEVPEDALRECVDRGFEFITKPRRHQLACFVLATKIPRFFFQLDMGSGKSKILLDAIRYRKWNGQLGSALICVPYTINVGSWEDQLRLHAPDLTYTLLDGSRERRFEAMDDTDSDVYVIQYMGLQVFMAGARRRTKRGTLKREVVARDALQFSSRFNFVALDECHIGLTTAQSTQYRLCKLLSWHGDYCYGATGTPMNREPDKLWPQFHVIDRGETLGPTLTLFRAAYFRELASRFTRSGITYAFDKAKRKHLHARLQHRSIRYEDHELSDLPPITHTPIPVVMTRAQLRRNEDLVKQAHAARLAGEPSPATFIRQRQTAAGFVSVGGEDNEERVEIEFSPNPKIDALQQFLQQLDAAEKLLVFHCYIYTGKLIRALLDRQRIRYAGVGHGFKDPGVQRRRFIDDPRCRVFVANCRAGGTGVDGLQHVCHFGMFYESPTSPSERRQAEKRLQREGQQHPVRFYDLVAQGLGIDRRTLDALAKGKDIFEAVVNGKEVIE